MIWGDLTIGYAFCGSFCTIKKSIEKLRELKLTGCKIIPIMSENAYSTDTRFGKSSDIVHEIEDICGRKVIKSITEAEPIGPKKMVDVLVIAPCTGNTLAKLSNAITDTCVTMAAKSHLRIGRPVLITLASNDGLGASATNIGKLMNTKNIFFTPFAQDDFNQKPNSLVANFDLLLPAIEAACDKKQLQPVIIQVN